MLRVWPGRRSSRTGQPAAPTVLHLLPGVTGFLEPKAPSVGGLRLTGRLQDFLRLPPVFTGGVLRLTGGGCRLPEPLSVRANRRFDRAGVPTVSEPILIDNYLCFKQHQPNPPRSPDAPTRWGRWPPRRAQHQEGRSARVRRAWHGGDLAHRGRGLPRLHHHR